MKKLVSLLSLAAVLAGCNSSSNTSETSVVKENKFHYFSANTLERSGELFITDGTQEGTLNLGDKLADLNVTLPNNAGQPVKLGDKWYFAVFRTIESKVRMAVTDGTLEGTKVFINGPELIAPYNLLPFNNQLFFAARDVSGTELWVTDEAEENGARLFKDIALGAISGAPAKLTAVGNQLFFTAYQTYTGQELWVSNGDSSDAGTHLVKDLTEDNFSARFGEFHGFKNALYFVQAGRLWVSDGTAEGTKELDMERRSANAKNFVAQGNHFFFTDSAVGADSSFWVSDGVTTTPLHHQDPGAGPVTEATSFANKMYFVAGQSLFEATTGYAKQLDLSTSNLPDHPLAPADLVVLNNKLLFSANLSENGNRELFQFDGSQASLVKNITGDSNSSFPQQLTELNGSVLFRANDGISGQELWKTDGTEAGTQLFMDIKAGASSSNLNVNFSATEVLYF